jgi:hypothetical protein
MFRKELLGGIKTVDQTEEHLGIKVLCKKIHLTLMVIILNPTG